MSLAAELRIPRAGSDRLPAVVLLHGSGGMSTLEDTWARHFNSMGIATLMVDSFTARGVQQTSANQDQLSRWAMVVDSYRALDVLASHPRIDPRRVVVMGFSRGGGAAHYSAMRRFYAMYGPDSKAEYAAHIAFYPTCNRVFRDGLDVVDKPIRIYHGAADDYIPVAECRLRVDQLRKAGKDAVLTEYADAHHVFDNPGFPLAKVPQVQTTRNCPPLEEVDGQIMDSQTRQPFSYASAPCVERGATAGYNPIAHANAVRDVSEFLSAVLKPAPAPR